MSSGRWVARWTPKPSAWRRAAVRNLATTPASPSPAPAPSAKPAAELLVGLLVTRAPIVTPAPHPFVTAYHNYRASLSNVQARPVPEPFYFKQGSLAAQRWQAAQTAAADAFAAANDGRRPETFWGNNRALAKPYDTETETVTIHPRDTDAANTAYTDLNRRQDEHLYLALRDETADGAWRLPTTPLRRGSASASSGGAGEHEGETLAAAAQRLLDEELGAKAQRAETWVVGELPVAVQLKDAPAPTFFLKSHLLGGTLVAPSDAPASSAFGWFTAEELASRLPPQTWEAVQHVTSSTAPEAV
ncbi:hypothetical protein CXG81DRAFT_25982 [Caulochytrium protostelioides]|uniref:Large ribosomal subunit protein mL46 N-terminal domain-containing protein n=1 Tax=Caulochytrium protostelioides TaxID=1555241 RepID=A0A4P9X7U8_9FUNG|nr:hypothetical protein CXG81DRAFT_25982 [Caulochytrium protostelioides]|eukprot:RKP01323.1 hypothetical protein CXG81DRAFT_25982 [Caulochytrium protostelioides]